jgi:hypothetical protein
MDCFAEPVIGAHSRDPLAPSALRAGYDAIGMPSVEVAIE